MSATSHLHSWISVLDAGDETTVHVQLGSAQLALFCAALARNRTLTDLALDDCHMDCAGAETLMRAVAAHPCLRRLSLQRNRVGDAGMRCVADALARHEPPRLEYLDVRFNPYTPRFVCGCCSRLCRVAAYV